MNIRIAISAMVESYRSRGGKAPIRAVILGCTHYPFVLPVSSREIFRK